MLLDISISIYINICINTIHIFFKFYHKIYCIYNDLFVDFQKDVVLTSFQYFSGCVINLTVTKGFNTTYSGNFESLGCNLQNLLAKPLK